MTNTKTLMLAAVAALSLCVGTAMAESDSQGGVDVISQPAFPGAVPARNATPYVSQPQAGSSDVDLTRMPNYPRQQPLLGGDGANG
jgi:hypothetical protein